MKQILSKEKVIKAVRKAAPYVGVFAMAGVRCYAGQSPFAKWITDMGNEAVTTWAVYGSILGMIIGILGMLLGGHEHKSKFGWTIGLSFVCLTVSGWVSYLQSEG